MPVATRVWRGSSQGPINPTDPIITTAEGAYFNMELAAFGGPNRPSAGLTYAAAAAHNPFLVEQLLRASINAVVADYNLSPPAGLDMGLVLGKSHN